MDAIVAARGATIDSRQQHLGLIDILSIRPIFDCPQSYSQGRAGSRWSHNQPHSSAEKACCPPPASFFSRKSLRANLVESAQRWPWSSLANRARGQPPPWLVPATAEGWEEAGLKEESETLGVGIGNDGCHLLCGLTFCVALRLVWCSF